LSFLNPGDERLLDSFMAGRLASARVVFQRVDQKARELYIRFAADIGTVEIIPGKTFRTVLDEDRWGSSWWGHPVSAKNCEFDPTFHYILSIAAVLHERRRLRPSSVVLVGPPRPVAEVLSGLADVRVDRAGKSRSSVRTLLYGLAHRAAKAWLEWRMVRESRRVAQPPPPLRAALAGYWDWSAGPGVSGEDVQDRYFGDLPQELDRAGLGPVGWFAWLDRRRKRGRRRLREMLAPLSRRSQVVALQSMLSSWDVVKAALDLRPLLRYLRLGRSEGFRSAFREGGLDYFPLFRRPLLQGFADYSLAHFRLASEAVSRAATACAPELLLTFQEHFLHSRAVYQGAQQADSSIRLGSTQHASYNHNKVYLYFDPETEFHGAPEGECAPRPHKIFAMGELGRRLFLECGYAHEDVAVTGSPRYDHDLKDVEDVVPAPRRKGASRELRALMVCTVDWNIEMDMLEAACLAAEGLGGVRLLIRTHPDRPLENHPGFAAFADKVELVRGGLWENLDKADVVLFTFTTVAEEAYLGGKAVWQWLPLGYNGSALSEVADIPRFSSAVELRRAFDQALNAGPPAGPGLEERRRVLKELFHAADGQAARRVAGLCADPNFWTDPPAAGNEEELS
jgi:hypothetical protein